MPNLFQRLFGRGEQRALTPESMLLASAVSTLPLQRYRKVGNRREKLPNAGFFENPAMVGTYRDWIFKSVTSLAYQGNAVGLVLERDDLE